MNDDAPGPFPPASTSDASTAAEASLDAIKYT
jgi:hypothetical protein